MSGYLQNVQNVAILFDCSQVKNDTDIENCKKDGGKAVPVGVTVDRTWQKRYGFNSLLGVVFIISVDTGEVLDYEIKCKHCFECTARSKWDRNSEKY